MRILTLVLSVVLASSPALAAKPDWAGGPAENGSEEREIKRQTPKEDKASKGEKVRKEEKVRKAEKEARAEKVGKRFSTDDETAIRRFYAQEHEREREDRPKNGKQKPLPYGLEKKLERGGELPPGWQRKVERGEVLDVRLRPHARPVPDELIHRLAVDRQQEEVLRLQDKVIRMSRGDGTIIDVIDIADVLTGRGMRE